MILPTSNQYPPDLAERRVPDVDAARTLGAGAKDGLEEILERRRDTWGAVCRGPADTTLLDRALDAVRLGHARLAVRHGRLGADFHAYHNEGHVVEICGGRIDRLEQALGPRGLDLRQGCALMMFGACHDLRQREAPAVVDGIGANERASIEETLRILDACGFERDDPGGFHVALELMIAGSTFDARPVSSGYAYNAADMVQSGGALASRLDHVLDRHRPAWRDEPALVEGLAWARVAADLDTANVAEPFAHFAATAENLCREREMLSGRSLAAGESALPALAFLTDAQDRFFFELHRFHSDEGARAFGPGKGENAPKIRALGERIRERFARLGPPRTGDEVIEAYRTELAVIEGSARQQ